MKVLRAVPPLREEIQEAKTKGSSVGLVPTMGALHEGHLALIDSARSSCDVVVMSIFVNPLQFGPHEDLDAYPRREKEDLEVARAAGVDLAFVPAASEMFPDGSQITVSAGRLGGLVEGAARPGHFDGVATVVAKLFNIVQPTTAFFGQKDAQQVAVIQSLVRDLDFSIEIEVCPTVREPDGLALSSRNAYLSPDERTRASVIWRSLHSAAAIAERGDVRAAEKEMRGMLEGAPGVEPEYALAVDPTTFEPASGGGLVLLVVAARIGTTRLIDNVLVDRRGGGNQ